MIITERFVPTELHQAGGAINTLLLYSIHGLNSVLTLRPPSCSLWAASHHILNQQGATGFRGPHSSYATYYDKETIQHNNTNGSMGQTWVSPLLRMTLSVYYMSLMWAESDSPFCFRWNGEIVRSPEQTAVEAREMWAGAPRVRCISSRNICCSALRVCRRTFSVLKPNIQVRWRCYGNQMSILAKQIKCVTYK